jgi:YHS domain-containing protein
MSRLILFVILLLLLYAILHSLIKDMPARRKKLNRGSGPEELVQDPCCHTYVPKRSAIKKKIAGGWFYFCNQECMENYINGIKKIKKNG